jgi:hypothetical protein
MDQIKLMSGPLKSAVITSSIATFAGMVMAVVFLFISISYWSSSLSKKNPVFMESFDYLMSQKGLSWFPNGMNYKYFYLTSVLQVFPFIIAILYMKYRNLPIEVGGPVVIILIVVLLLHACASIPITTLLLYNAKNSMKSVNDRVAQVNKYIYARMYKGTKATPVKSNEDEEESEATAPVQLPSSTSTPIPKTPTLDFYSHFQVVQTDMFMIKDIAEKALKSLPVDISAEDLAKAVFTITLFAHFHRLGIRNPNIYEAIGLFNKFKLLVPFLFNPADYFLRNGTYVKDLAQVIAVKNSTYVNSDLVDKNNKLKKVMQLNSEWVANINNIANSIYPEDNILPFIVMSVGMVVIQVLVFSVLVYILSRDSVKATVLQFATSIIPKENEVPPSSNKQ